MGNPPPVVALEADDRVVRLNGRSVRLTPTQFSILSYLIERPGAWVTGAVLIRDVLGTHHRPDTPLIRVHIHALRRRLGAFATWLESDPHRSLGYRWNSQGGPDGGELG